MRDLVEEVPPPCPLGNGEAKRSGEVSLPPPLKCTPLVAVHEHGRCVPPPLPPLCGDKPSFMKGSSATGPKGRRTMM
jgi:hypothetical protein